MYRSSFFFLPYVLNKMQWKFNTLIHIVFSLLPTKLLRAVRSHLQASLLLSSENYVNIPHHLMHSLVTLPKDQRKHTQSINHSMNNYNNCWASLQNMFSLLQLT